MDTTLRIPLIRERLINELGPVLEPHGYKIKDRRGENRFLKKNGEGYFEIQFFYDNYFPIDYRVYCIFACSQISVQHVLKDFSNATGRPLNIFANIIFSEGDFVDGLREKLVKYRSGYKNRLVSSEDLEKACLTYKALINDKILPMQGSLSTVEGTADYLQRNRDLLVSNCNEGPLMTSLIALHEFDRPACKELYGYYMEELPKIKPYGLVAEKTIEVVKDLYEYLQKE